MTGLVNHQNMKVLKHAFNYVDKPWTAPPIDILISPRNKTLMHQRVQSAKVRTNRNTDGSFGSQS